MQPHAAGAVLVGSCDDRGMRGVVVVAALAACSHGNPGGHPGDAGQSPDASTSTGALCQSGSNTTSAGSAQITLDVDVALGPLQQQFSGAPVQSSTPLPVSDYIYGINQYPENNYFLSYPAIQFGLMRWGGDSYSDWNWTNNDDNVGRDNGYTNTNQFMPFAYGNVPSDPSYHGNPHDTNPVGALVDGNDSVPSAQQRGTASLVTVSVQDYLAANADDMAVTYAPSADFGSNSPANQSAFVSHMAQYTGAPIFYELDNEPNYWSGTHPEVFGTNDLSFDELVARDTAYATAVKAAAPSAIVFGPVVAGVDGMTSLDDYGNLASSNPYATSGTDAVTYFLSKLGPHLVDVLDLHYYNDTKDKTGTAKAPDDCVQGARDYWDPTYSTPDTTYDDYITGWKPRTLIPRIESKIAANAPGTGLAFTEYNNGCELAIAGGVAEADTLGVFGQYGVFAATAWPLQSAAPGGNWLVGAFGAYRDYDGSGATVGTLAVSATSSDVTQVAVYGFAHSGTAAGVEVVAINRTGAPVAVELRLSNACTVATARVFQLTSASAAMASAGPNVAVAGNALAYTLPATSVTTFELR
jgi:mannan endo-1,4-beta-mannosidase